MVITRIGVWSAAKLYAAIAGTMGLIIGFIIAVLSAVGAAAGMQEDAGLAAGFLGIGAVIIAPIFYGVMGLVGGAIGALLYNIFAGLVGGLEIETR
jgi:hypothetical protein